MYVSLIGFYFRTRLSVQQLHLEWELTNLMCDL